MITRVQRVLLSHQVKVGPINLAVIKLEVDVFVCLRRLSPQFHDNLLATQRLFMQLRFILALSYTKTKSARYVTGLDKLSLQSNLNLRKFLLIV